MNAAAVAVAAAATAGQQGRKQVSTLIVKTVFRLPQPQPSQLELMCSCSQLV